MYRCLTCKKPFVTFKEIAVSSEFYGVYFISVTPCCESHSYSHIAGYSLSIVSGGSARTFRQLSESEVVELALNWASGFQKENNE